MLQLGAKEVIIAARRTDELERVRTNSGFPMNVKIWQIDLSKLEECLNRAQELKIDKLDILINNGGVSQREIFTSIDFETVETLMNTNFMSHVALI